MGDENGLSNDPLHGGVDDDALEAAARALFESENEPTGDAVEPPADGAAPTAATEPPEGGAPHADAPSSGVDDGEVWEYDLGDDQKLTINREQAKAYAEFEAFLQANPELAEAISGSVVGTHKFLPVETPSPVVGAPAGSPVATPDPLAPPPELDMDDPVQKAVWDRMVETRTQLDTATAALARHEQVITTQRDDTTRALINRASASFQEEHKLTSEDMDEIQKVTARLNVMPALMNPIDPITGLPRQVDPLKAMEDAFDLARWQIPRLREAEIAAVQAQTRSNNSRKAKLSSLGGSSGSVPRQQNTVPTNPAERHQAMLAEMGAMLQGNWINPEDT